MLAIVVVYALGDVTINGSVVYKVILLAFSFLKVRLLAQGFLAKSFRFIEPSPSSEDSLAEGVFTAGLLRTY